MSGLRAYDIVMAAEVWTDSIRHVQEKGRGAPVFLADDAHLMLYHTIDASGGSISTATLPPAVMPFDRFWVEWAALNLDNSPYKPTDATNVRQAVLCVWSAEARILVGVLMTTMLSPTGVPIVVVAGQWFIPFSVDGFETEKMWFGPTKEFREAAAKLGRDTWEATNERLTVLFVLGLLGCKNVVRTRGQMPRALRRHPGLYASTASDIHYTLDIPGARDFRESIAGASEAQQRRLHIVRGHFADYMEGAGLFGKLHGKYYIAPHVRGSADRGTVTKDYRVVAPVGS